jgi:hypothetical protein
VLKTADGAQRLDLSHPASSGLTVIGSLAAGHPSQIGGATRLIRACSRHCQARSLASSVFSALTCAWSPVATARPRAGERSATREEADRLLNIGKIPVIDKAAEGEPRLTATAKTRNNILHS